MNMNIDQDTILTTERLKLRPVDLSDVNLVWEVSRFEGFTDGMTWDPPVSRQEIVEVTRRNQAHWEQGEEYVFTINLLTPVCPIGRIGLRKEEVPSTWNIGFWLHPDHWGNGFTSEAARAVLDFGFNTLRAERIVTVHATWNKRSQSVIQRLGFNYLGVNPAGFYKKGNPVKVFEYVLRCSL